MKGTKWSSKSPRVIKDFRLSTSRGYKTVPRDENPVPPSAGRGFFILPGFTHTALSVLNCFCGFRLFVQLLPDRLKTLPFDQKRPRSNGTFFIFNRFTLIFIKGCMDFCVFSSTKNSELYHERRITDQGQS